MQAKKINNSTDKVVVKKIIKASREDVFDAWTKPEIMNQWYVGGKGSARTTVDLRVGGKYTNEMLIDCVTNPGEVNSYMHSGEYLEIVKPEKLVFTWNSHAVQNTKVTVSLREYPGKLKLQ